MMAAIFTPRDDAGFTGDRQCAVALVLYGAEWCPPCKPMKHALRKLAKEFDDVRCIYVNTDALEASSQHITALPTVHLFLDGMMVEEIETGAGFMSRARQALRVAVEDEA